MLECYSNNATVGENEAVAFTNTALKKGHTVEAAGATIQFNKCGIYEVAVSATASAPSAASYPADVELRLMKNGIVQPQAKSRGTLGSKPAKIPLGFTTLVQVPENNSCSMCAAPTTCSIVNTGAEAAFDNINIVVTKLI